MSCEDIITGVRESGINNGEPTSYFVIHEENPIFNDNYDDLIATLVFQPWDMRKHLGHLRDGMDFEGLCVLVSLDGKFGIFRPFINGQVQFDVENEQLVPFFIREDGHHIGVEGSIQKMISVLNSIISEKPELSYEYQYIPDPSNFDIKPRFNFRWMDKGFGLASTEVDIEAAMRNPEAATDDALALLYISSDCYFPEDEQIQPRIECELDFRLTKQSSFAWRFFDFSEVTKLELNQRRLRARWNLELFKKKFEGRRDTFEESEDVYRYLRSLDNDVLAELTMVGFYSGFEEKSLLFMLSERLPGFGDY